MPRLFESLTINDVTLRNRVGVSPMCQYSSEEGFANEWHMVHLGTRALGGAGLVIVEATGVVPEGRISPNCLGIWSDRHAEKLAPIFSFLKAQGAVPGIQIAHAGRKGSVSAPWLGGKPISVDAPGGWLPVGPSAEAFSPQHTTPHEMTIADIKQLQGEFVAAAKRADHAGALYLELHAAHGYLLHSFYSPLTNKRQDEYGGTFANRIRFCLETARAIREVWPAQKIFGVRLSCTDWLPNGWVSEDSVALAKELKNVGVDIIDCSSGGLSPESMPPGNLGREAGYQVSFSDAIKNQSNVRTAAVGAISEPLFAEKIIAEGKADIVLMAREFLRNPYWPIHAAKVLGLKPDSMIPKQYGRAFN